MITSPTKITEVYIDTGSGPWNADHLYMDRDEDSDGDDENVCLDDNADNEAVDGNSSEEDGDGNEEADNNYNGDGEREIKEECVEDREDLALLRRLDNILTGENFPSLREVHLCPWVSSKYFPKLASRDMLYDISKEDMLYVYYNINILNRTDGSLRDGDM